MINPRNNASDARSRIFPRSEDDVSMIDESNVNTTVITYNDNASVGILNLDLQSCNDTIGVTSSKLDLITVKFNELINNLIDGIDKCFEIYKQRIENGEKNITISDYSTRSKFVVQNISLLNKWKNFINIQYDQAMILVNEADNYCTYRLDKYIEYDEATNQLNAGSNDNQIKALMQMNRLWNAIIVQNNRLKRAVGKLNTYIEAFNVFNNNLTKGMISFRMIGVDSPKYISFTQLEREINELFNSSTGSPSDQAVIDKLRENMNHRTDIIAKTITVKTIQRNVDYKNVNLECKKSAPNNDVDMEEEVASIQSQPLPPSRPPSRAESDLDDSNLLIGAAERARGTGSEEVRNVDYEKEDANEADINRGSKKKQRMI